MTLDEIILLLANRLEVFRRSPASIWTTSFRDVLLAGSPGINEAWYLIDLDLKTEGYDVDTVAAIIKVSHEKNPEIELGTLIDVAAFKIVAKENVAVLNEPPSEADQRPWYRRLFGR